MDDAPIFAALADPMRRNLLVNLAENGTKTATQLAREYPITRQGILKHMQILREAGLVVTDQHGRDKVYRLTLEPLNELEQWIKDLNSKLDNRLLRLKNFIESE